MGLAGSTGLAERPSCDEAALSPRSVAWLVPVRGSGLEWPGARDRIWEPGHRMGSVRNLGAGAWAAQGAFYLAIPER